MKKLLIVLISFLILGCSSDNDHQSLPPASQTGKGTFACLVDGKPFIDQSGSSNGISFNCYYQYVDGEYYFGIQGSHRINDLITIGFGTNMKEITEGQTYNLLEDSPGNAFGRCSFNPDINSQENSTTDNLYTGEIHVTRFDLVNQIISGTYWMDIKNPFTNETVKITEGRFDTHFGL